MCSESSRAALSRSRALVRSMALGLAVVIASSASGVRAEIGGHRLEFVAMADRIDFDGEIRFEDDTGTSLGLLAEIYPGATLGLEIARVEARDRELGQFADVITVAIRGRAEPFRLGPIAYGVVSGVSFLAFENQEPFDSVSEGFELGPALRWTLDSVWRVRAEWIWRVQTVSRPRLDENGLPTGDDDETGFVWTSLLRLGVGVAF